MTQDEIIRMAREAGLFNQHNEDLLQDKEVMAQFERFAALVAAHEREACAKVCDEHGFYGAAPARDIRARGEK